MSKKLNEQGLSHLLLKLKSIFATKQHSHTKSEVGLSKVDNTSDAEKSVKYAATAHLIQVDNKLTVLILKIYLLIKIQL